MNMESPRPAVPKPSPIEFMKLVTSPTVKIFIGEHAEPYILPKALIGYYSPYFAACFNGNFKEGIEGVLRLPDENPKFMEVVIEHMRGHTAKLLDIGPKSTDAEKVKKRLATCWEFLKFCDAYELVEVASALAKPLQHAFEVVDYPFDKEHFDFALSRLHEDNPTYQVLIDYLAKHVIEAKKVQDFLQSQNNDVNAAVLKAIIKLTDHTGPKDGKHLAVMWRCNSYFDDDGYNSETCPNCGECCY